MYGKTGEMNPNWKGGISATRQLLYSSSEWKRAVAIARKRDNNKCQRCDIRHTSRNKLHAHHIVSFSVEELRTDPNNLILLCRDCHSWVHSLKNHANEFIREHNDK